MNTAVGGLIKKAREKKGITQTQVGRLIKMSEQFVGRIEAGEAPLPLSRVNTVRKVLRITRSKMVNAYVRDYAKKIEKTVYNKKA